MKIFWSLSLILLSVASADHFLRRKKKKHDKDGFQESVSDIDIESEYTRDYEQDLVATYHNQRSSKDPSLERKLFSGGDDINNLAPTVDLPLRFLVLFYDVALFPIWLPLIAIGATEGATYRDLFSCGFGKSPFVPCLYNKKLISEEQYNCFLANGVTWGCLLGGSIANNS